MTRRRVFDIDFPDEAAVPTGTAMPRKGPMASAISENAQALKERAELEARIRAENDALAAEFVRLRDLGLVVDLLPLESIRATELARDRSLSHDEELEGLKASIREIGLSNPIRVVRREGGYELIQGYRRLRAYRELLDETGDREAFGAIPAGMVAEGETVAGLYRRMVDENLIRKDISFAEMADLARAYVADPECPAETIEGAVESLYASAGRQKKIYIRNFAGLMDLIGDDLKHAPAIPRNLGLEVWGRLAGDPKSLQDLRDALSKEPHRDEERELNILKVYAEGRRGHSRQKEARRKVDVMWRGAVARVSASDGLLELKIKRDFGAVDQDRIDRAVQMLLDEIYPCPDEGEG